MRMIFRTLALLLAGFATEPGMAQAQAQVQPQPQAAPAQAVPTQAVAGALSPEQARRAAELLRDDRSRANVLTVLDGLAAAGAVIPQGSVSPTPAVAEPAAPPPAAVAPAAVPAAVPAAAPAPAKPVTLLPDSLGVQVLDQATAAAGRAADYVKNTVQTVNDLPLLQRWLTAVFTDPASRARLIDTAWKLLTVMVAGVLAEAVVSRLLRRPRAWLARSAPEGDAAPGPALGLAAADDQPTAEQPDPPRPDPPQMERIRRHRLGIAWRTLKRLPVVLVAGLMNLVPVAVFAGTSHLLLGTTLAQPRNVQLVILGMAQAYVAARAILVLVRMLVAPDEPRLQLLAINREAGWFIRRWARRIVVIGMGGYALAGAGLQFGLYLAAYETAVKLDSLAVHICLVLMVLQARRPVTHRLRSHRGATSSLAQLQNRMAAIWHVPTIMLIVGSWLVYAVELRDGYARLLRFTLLTVLVLAGARLVWILVVGSLDRVLRAEEGEHARFPGLEKRVAFYHPIVRGAATAMVGLLTLCVLLEVWGLGVFTWVVRDGVGARVASAMLLIVVTLVLAVLVWEGVNAAIARHIARLTEGAMLARAARLRTLLPMLRTALLVTLLLVVALTVLSEIGVNIAPLLAGAGVIGIAVGFGSQKLVQDLITGLFLLLENAMQVGDVVTLGGLSGTVEALSIRTIRLRALDGSVHIIPFSAVTTVTNQTRDYGYAVMDVSVGLNEEPDRVAQVLRDLAAEMRKDERWAPLLTSDLDVMGVEKFVDSAWVMRVRIKTSPASRMPVGREINRRVKIRFDELAIESPMTSHRVLQNNPAPPPEPVTPPAGVPA